MGLGRLEAGVGRLRAPAANRQWLVAGRLRRLLRVVMRLVGRSRGRTLNAALANELGKLIADFTGRGAQRSRAFLHQDVVICVLEDGATNAEKNLVAAGKADLVRVQRDALQRAMAPRLIAAVERLTHPTVRTFLSGCDDTGGSSVEAFVLELEPAATPATPSPQIDPRADQER